MKTTLLSIAVFCCMASAQAQKVTVPEPEYKGQVAVINTDSTTTLLQKETGEHKAKSSAFALLSKSKYLDNSFCRIPTSIQKLRSNLKGSLGNG